LFGLCVEIDASSFRRSRDSMSDIKLGLDDNVGSGLGKLLGLELLSLRFLAVSVDEILLCAIMINNAAMRTERRRESNCD